MAETLTGAFVLVVAIAFLAYAVAHSGRSAGSGYDLEARFDNIAGLSVGSDVKIAGVKVGTVTNERIDPKTFTAVVSMSIQNEIQLPKGHRGFDYERKSAGAGNMLRCHLAATNPI